MANCQKFHDVDASFTAVYTENHIRIDDAMESPKLVAANSRRWWRNSGMFLNAVLTLNWSDQLGLPRLS